MEPSEIAKRLELKPWAEFKAAAIEKNAARTDYPPRKRIEELPRQTGRTMRMITNLLSTISKGMDVRVIAGTPDMAKAIVHRAREQAVRLGLDPKLILDRSEKEGIEFADHTFYEAW